MPKNNVCYSTSVENPVPISFAGFVTAGTNKAIAVSESALEAAKRRLDAVVGEQLQGWWVLWSISLSQTSNFLIVTWVDYCLTFLVIILRYIPLWVIKALHKYLVARLHLESHDSVHKHKTFFFSQVDEGLLCWSVWLIIRGHPGRKLTPKAVYLWIVFSFGLALSCYFRAFLCTP